MGCQWEEGKPLHFNIYPESISVKAGVPGDTTIKGSGPFHIVIVTGRGIIQSPVWSNLTDGVLT